MLASNRLPDYPPSLREAGIEGTVQMKLLIEPDGSVKIAKLVAMTPQRSQCPEAAAFLSAVIEVVQTWRYEPATLGGAPIALWLPVAFPFTLRVEPAAADAK